MEDEDTQELIQAISKGFEKLEERFNELDNKLESVEKRIKSVNMFNN